MDSGFRRNDGQNPKPGGGAGVTSSSMGFFNNPLKGDVNETTNLKSNSPGTDTKTTRGTKQFTNYPLKAPIQEKRG